MSLYSPSPGGSTPVWPTAGDAGGSDVDAEYWVLTSALGGRLVELVEQVGTPGPSDVARWRKLAAARVVAAACRLADSRRRGRAKFALADRMWLASAGLEQATAEIVARHKAARFEAPLVVDLCSGMGGDSLALARRGNVLAVDLDLAMCRRLRWNARVFGVEDRILACRSRADDFAIPPGAWVHIDPDRRAERASRARVIGDYSPGPLFLRELAANQAGGAIKLSPASDFASVFPEPRYEVELISLRGECKEATVWFGSPVSCRRRATRLPENVTWTDRDGPALTGARASISAVSTWIYDPDPALIRAGLLDSFAEAHGLCRFAEDVDYLTSDRLVATPFLSPFLVESVHRLDLKHLRRLISEQDLGVLEIKVRGLDVSPESLRSRLRPRGTRAGTLILAGGNDPARVILARRP